MYKLIDSSSFFDYEEPSITIIDPNSTSSLIKMAADNRVQDFIAGLEPDQGKIFVHINAMGAGEYYGGNKNADYFPEENLKEYYKTFETSPAHVFKHHLNKDPEIAIGKVLFAIYNERMHRVELIAEIDREKGADVVRRIEAGEYPSTSMACKTKYDVCSICKNKAHTRQEYCSHLTTMLGKQLPDGRKVMALNIAPLKFFDISIVIRPADITSSILQKVAYASVSSAELAEDEGITDEGIKEASFKKFSELIKRVEGGEVTKLDPQLNSILSQVKDPDERIIEVLKNIPISETLNAFAEMGISPSPTFLAELISRITLQEGGRGLGPVAVDLVAFAGANRVELPDVEFDKSAEVSPLTVKTLYSSLETSSLLPEYVEKRASNSTGVGYANFTGTIIPTQRELDNVIVKDKAPESIIKTLLKIGATALLAKFYIDSEINQKINQVKGQNGVKIILTKKASDYSVVAKLSKAAMERAVIVQPTPDDNGADFKILSPERLLRKLLSSSNPTGKKIALILKFKNAGDQISNNEEA